MIDLTSDTATRPTPDMLKAMMAAEVGDDVFRKDPTVNRLEAYAAELFGMEAALYCPSGTMTNQLAIKCHTQPLDEVICDKYSHVYQYEGGVYALLSGVSMNLIDGTFGKIQKGQVSAAVKPRYDWLPISRLLVVENTCNKGGGSIYTLQEATDIVKEARAHNLACHLDGARLFNALVETNESPAEWGKLFDTISICLSKGLGAPVGSLLLGSQELIARARRYRKVMGGGMRQAGYLAAAGIYALQNNIDRLAEDNRRAKRLGEALQKLPYVAEVRPVQSNIVIFDLIDKHSTPDDSLRAANLASESVPLPRGGARGGFWTSAGLIDHLKAEGILAVPFGPQTVRFTTHLGISEEDIDNTIAVLNRMNII